MKTPSILVALALLIFGSVAFAAQPADAPAGLCYANTDDNQRVILPLESSEVVMTVTPATVETELVQTFTNRTSGALEATYLYPLPPDATITHFELRHADRMITSVVREKQQARAIYETALAEGKKTALLEQHDPSLFSTKVANFLPGETVKVAIRFIQPVDIATDEVTVRFPMTTGRKYFPADVTPGTPGVSAENPVQVDAAAIAEHHYYAFDILLSGFPVQGVSSPSHRVAVSAESDNHHRVFLQENITIPDRDFILQIALETRSEPRSTVAIQQTSTGSYGVFTVFPPPARQPSKGTTQGRDILFLLDHSGSMEGRRIESLRLGVAACLMTLSPQDRFQIVFFDSRHEFYRDQWVSASADEVATAVRRVQAMLSGSGTEMQPALAASLDFIATSADPGRASAVFLLTDGDVGNADTLLSLIEKKIEKTRLFTFGIGSAPNAFLIKRMAELGQGQARFIADDGAVAKELADLFSTLDAPVLSDLNLILRDASGQTIVAQIEPRQLGNVFARRPLQAMFATTGPVPVEVLLNGQREDEKVSVRLPLAATPLRGDGLEKRFGRLVYEELEAERRRAAGNGADVAEIGRQMREAALRYQLVTEFTSRVAVEERTSRDPNAALGSVAVPLYHAADSEGTIELTPFMVSTEEDEGYTSATTLAGTRLNTELRDIGSSVTVITHQFLKDVGATNTESLLAYTREPDCGIALPETDAFATTDGVPFATLTDPAFIEQLTLQPIHPDRMRITQRGASFRRQNVLTTRFGDEGYRAVTLDSSGSLTDDRSLAGRVVLTHSHETRAREGLLLDVRKDLGDDRLEGTAQWQRLYGYGDVRLVKASYGREAGDSLGWRAGVVWHQIRRTDASQFRLGSPTAIYDDLGFMNLDLLTAPTDGISDFAAQAEIYLPVAGTRQRHRAWFQFGWHRQTSDWLAPEKVSAPGRRDNLGGEVDWVSMTSDQKITAGITLGWMEHKMQNQTTSRVHARSTRALVTWEFLPGFRMFLRATDQEMLPWLSTGRFKEEGGRWIPVTPRLAHNRSGQAGFRMNVLADRLILEAALYRETVDDRSYRDWAWERDHGAAGPVLLPDGILRQPFSYGTWSEMRREGWTGNLTFIPTPGFNLMLNWYVDWRNEAPYRGGNRRLSWVTAYTFPSGRLKGLGLGFGLTGRNTLTFNDGHALHGGWRSDFFLKYERRVGRGFKSLTQLNFGNLSDGPARPTRFAVDHGHQLVLSQSWEF